MPAVKGRSRRPHHAITVPMQGHVAPDTRAKARAVANALGVSMSTYLDQLVQQDVVDDTGRPVWWPKDSQGEIDYSAAS